MDRPGCSKKHGWEATYDDSSDYSDDEVEESDVSSQSSVYLCVSVYTIQL